MSPSAALSMPLGIDAARADDERSPFFRLLRRSLLLMLGVAGAWLIAMLLHSPSASAAPVASPAAPSQPAAAQQPVASVVQGVAGLLDSVTNTTLPGLGQVISQVPAITPATLSAVENSPVLAHAPAVKKVVAAVRVHVVKPVTSKVLTPVTRQLATTLTDHPVQRVVQTLTGTTAPVIQTLIGAPVVATPTVVQDVGLPTASAVMVPATDATDSPVISSQLAATASAAHGFPVAAFSASQGHAGHGIAGARAAARSAAAAPSTPSTPSTPAAPALPSAPLPVGPSSTGTSGPVFAAVQTETTPGINTWCAVIATSKRHPAPNTITDDRSFSPD